MDLSTFSELGLSADLIRAVDDQGYREATPIQRKAIPHVLEGRDVLAGAQTGTGKTAAFALPILQRLGRRRGPAHAPRALILTPTRELAAQIGESVKSYGRYLEISSAVIFGGVGIQPQISKLRSGVDLVVATPGRLLDHVEQRTIDLSAIEILVLDEADRMLDMGFIRDIRRILKLLPGRRQNLLFSATFPKEIRDLAANLLNEPLEIQVAQRNSAAEGVHQIVHPVDRGRKRELLTHCIHEGDWRQVLVFTRTKHGANRLAEQLNRDGLDSAAIHGNKSQTARTRALAEFKAGQLRILVATDIAARGLDIHELPYVVNYELPNVPGDYVHRIGRTARAGRTGHAVSLVCIDEHGLLADIERLLKRDIARTVVPGFEPDARVRAEPIQHGRTHRRGQRDTGPRRHHGSGPSGTRRPHRRPAARRNSDI